MAVSENDLVVGPLTPSAGVSTISLDFYFESAEWLEVYSSGSETPLVLNTDYTVTGAGSGSGSIELLSPPDGATSYAIYLVVPLRRSSDMQLRGEFKSNPFNIEMDRLWQALQSLDTRVRLSLSVGKTSVAPAALATADLAARAGRVIKFSTDGSELQLGPTESQIEEAEQTAQTFLNSMLIPISETDTSVLVSVGNLYFVSENDTPYPSITLEAV